MKYGVLLVVVAVSGCASSSITPEQASQVPFDRFYQEAPQSENAVPVQVTRDSGGMDDRFCSVDFSVDNDKAATFKPGEKAEIYVEPGKHVYSAKATSRLCGFGRVETVANTTNNNPTALRIHFPFKGGLRLSQTIY